MSDSRIGRGLLGAIGQLLGKAKEKKSIAGSGLAEGALELLQVARFLAGDAECDMVGGFWLGKV